MKKIIVKYLFMLILCSNIYLAQSEININSGNSIFVPEGAQVFADRIRVNEGASFILENDECGTCEDVELIIESQSAFELIEQLISEIYLLDNLNKGQKNALISKLENALNNLEMGNKISAINQMGAFINQVEAFIMGGILDNEEEDGLIDEANKIIATINALEKTAPIPKAENNIINEYSLRQNYPNPFNPSTTIKYSIPKQSNITFKVFDVLGSEVATLINKEQPHGNYEVEFDCSELTSGIYFYILKAGEFVEIKKMILLK